MSTEQVKRVIRVNKILESDVKTGRLVIRMTKEAWEAIGGSGLISMSNGLLWFEEDGTVRITEKDFMGSGDA